MTTCVLVADSGAAKIYMADKRLTDIDLFEEVDNPEGRLTRSELDSDRPGAQRSAAMAAAVMVSAATAVRRSTPASALRAACATSCTPCIRPAASMT